MMFIAAVLLAAPLALAPAAVRADSGPLLQMNQVVPVDFALQVCATNTLGEWVGVSGDHHIVMTVVNTPSGVAISTFTANAQGWVGIGQTSGAHYQVSAEALQQTVSTTAEGAVLALVERVHVNGALGHGATQIVFHFTVTPSGAVSSDSYKLITACSL